MKPTRLTALFATTLLFVSGCGEGVADFAGEEEDILDIREDALAELDPVSDRGGLGASTILDELTEFRTHAATVIDSRKSLIVTDQVVLSSFTLRAVMDQLVAQSGVVS